MVQEFNVLRCYSCQTFQVDQVKKSSNKWSCKVCHEKQSVKEIYFRGTGKDCRINCQQLNMKRLDKDICENQSYLNDEQNGSQLDSSHTPLVNGSELVTSPFNDDDDLFNDFKKAEQEVGEIKDSSKWNNYLPNIENIDDETNTDTNNDDIIMFRDSNRKRTKSKPTAHDNTKRKYNNTEKKNEKKVVSTYNDANGRLKLEMKSPLKNNVQLRNNTAISNPPLTQSQFKVVDCIEKYNLLNESKTSAGKVINNNNNNHEDFSTLLMNTNNSDYSNTDSRLLTESLTDKQTSFRQSASNPRLFNKASTDKENTRLLSAICQSPVSFNDNKVPIASEAGSKWSMFLEVEDENNESEDGDIFQDFTLS